MNDYRDCCAVVKLQDGKYLLAGGMSSDLGVGQLQSMEIFNPSNNSFTPELNMNYAKHGPAVPSLQMEKSSLWDVGNYNTSGIIGELYDPVANQCVATGI